MKSDECVVLILFGVFCSSHLIAAADGVGVQGSLQETAPGVSGVDTDQRWEKLERSLEKLEQIVRSTDDSTKAKLIAFEKNIKARDDTLQEILRTLKRIGVDSPKIRDESTTEQSVEPPGRVNSSQIDVPSTTSLPTVVKKITEPKSEIGEVQPTTTVKPHVKKFSTSNEGVSYRSCKEVPTKVSGIYPIKLASNETISVYCEQKAHDGGWIVFQHRFNGQVDFYRNWTEYRDGFGDLAGEFWLGLECLHQLTSTQEYELMVEVEDYEGHYGWAKYEEFVIRNETEKYRLKFGYYIGTAGNSMKANNGREFSTMDYDHDRVPSINCAVNQHGAWWYHGCTDANLNGPYAKVTDMWQSMSWWWLQKDYRSMSFTRMMMREVNE